MDQYKLELALEEIDKVNAEDPNIIEFGGESFPKEILYSLRMTERLFEYEKKPAPELQIAARAQHIKRWTFPRDQYPNNRAGYLKWRKEAAKFHSELTAEILNKVGYDKKFIDKVSWMIEKTKVKIDRKSQVLEDVCCLVFIEHYLEEFAEKHNDEKVIEIIMKTLNKMSDRGLEEVLSIELSDKLNELIDRATESWEDEEL